MQGEVLKKILRTAEFYGEPLTNKSIQTLVHDSRKIQPNCCFIAIKGEHFDGHDSIFEVVKAGATIVVVEQLKEEWLTLPVTICLVPSTFRAQSMIANAFYEEPSTKLNVVAITGTNGKTTTSSMISDWLMKLDHKTGLLGTLHYKVDQHYYPAINTTPNALELQRLFSEMVEVGCKDAIIEASSHALQLGRLWYTEIDCAIYTNLTREHLDFHQTMEKYAAAKSLLFSQLGQSFKQSKPKLAILNADDSYVELMKQSTAADIVTYGIENSQATIYATNIIQNDAGLFFNLNIDKQTFEVQLNMFGVYNVSNYLAAFACLKYYYGYNTETIIKITKEFSGVSGRMQRINDGQPYNIVVDFAHTPDAIENVLKDLKSSTSDRLITVIGHSGGNRDSGARPEIGDIVFNYSDYIFFTADNPRHESVQKICREIIGTHDEVSYEIIEKREEAIRSALLEAKSGDTIIFAGKGGEPYQVIGDEYLPFDEVDVIQTQLKQIIFGGKEYWK